MSNWFSVPVDICTNIVMAAHAHTYTPTNNIQLHSAGYRGILVYNSMSIGRHLLSDLLYPGMRPERKRLLLLIHKTKNQTINKVDGRVFR